MKSKCISWASRPAAGQPAWYCLRSHARQEQVAAGQLRMIVGISVFWPRVRFKRATPRGVVWITEGMFPRYLFARFTLAEMHRRVRYTLGVNGIVQFGDQYPTISDTVLDELRDFTGSAEVRELNCELLKGDQVKIVSGAFAGLAGVVTQVLPAKQRVTVLMDFLGRQIQADIERTRVLPNPLELLGKGVDCFRMP
jgi:transcriptional antiterminator RfaH